MARPRHPVKELEEVLRGAERRGWRVEKSKRYYRMYCPCSVKHAKSVHLTPSAPTYVLNLMGHLKRATCWDTQHREGSGG